MIRLKVSPGRSDRHPRPRASALAAGLARSAAVALVRADDVALALLKHHTATELVDRAEAGRLLRRERDDEDHRVVRLHITRTGAAKLARLSRQHLAELQRLRAGIV